MTATLFGRPFRLVLVLAIMITGLGLLPPMPVRADTGLPPIGAENSPYAIAVNPVTGKVYVVNNGSNSVTVINGMTHSKTTISVGTSPQAVAVNPVTNKVYVATYFNITVIDGATQGTTNVNTGAMQSQAVAVNSVTNKVYVANYDSGTITILDGATLNTTSLNVGDRPIAIAVNPATNKIYVVNYGSGSVTVLDGATLLSTTIAVGSQPVAVAINPATNKIYVANYNGNNVTVINGFTNSTATVAVGTNPQAIAVNPVTNKIYVANYNSNNVTVIDSGTNLTTTVAVGSNPRVVVVNPTTNKIYAANYNGSNVTVIDGLTHNTTTIATGGNPRALAVNPVLNRIYAANYSSASVTVIDGSSNSTISASTGNISVGVAVNPVTDRAYIVNNGDNTLTMIDGTTNQTATFPIGLYPNYVAVNPMTNKIYVSNLSGANVTVMDGLTHLTTTVAAGTSPYAMEVNPVTNEIYVANNGSANVTIIDGETLSTTTVAAGTQPCAMTFNPVTNKIYVANGGSNTVTVIDGLTHDTLTVTVGTQPTAIAVNAVTNKVYVTNYGSSNVTVIDGTTLNTTTVAAGLQPIAIAVNPLTNKIYVANNSNSTVTVIDGPTNATGTIAVGSSPQSVAVNPTTNQIYVANEASNTVTVIDGATNTTTSVSAGAFTWAAAVNPLNQKVYIANRIGKTATILTPASAWPAPLTVAITPLPGNVSRTATPTFTLTTQNQSMPYQTGVHQVYYQIDTWQGTWLTATNLNPNQWTAASTALSNGIHILYAYAVDGQDAGATQSSPSASPMIGSIRAYLFLVRKNRTPVTAGEAYTTPLNTPLSVVAPGLLSNDSDPDRDSLQVTLKTPPTHGTIILNADGAFLFAPTTGFIGQDTFDYSVSDGTLTATARVTLTVIQTNHAPVAAGDFYTTPQESALNLTAPGVLANDSDPDGDSLTAALVTAPAHGTAALAGNGALLYLPAEGFTGQDFLDYGISDGVFTATARVTLTVVQTNHAPVAAGDFYTTPQESALNLTAPGVLANDSDPDSDSLTAALVTAPAHGTAALAGNGALLYLPAEGFTGQDFLDYGISDGVFTATARVTLTVVQTNHAPVAADDFYTTPQESALNLTPPGLLANDSDPDGDSLTATLVTAPAHGTAALAGNGALLYLPAEGFTGQDFLDYGVSDGVFTATARVTLTVTAVNHPVMARDDIAVMQEDSVLITAAPGVLGNDTDPDGDGLTAELLTTPFTGSLTLAADGAYTYTPPLNFNNVVSFTYRVQDSGHLSATATVYLLVQAVNDAPGFTAGASQVITQGMGAQVVPGWATAIHAGAANERGQVLNFTVGADPATLFAVQPTVDLSGTLRYTPAAGINGIATVTVILRDNGGTAYGGVDHSLPQSFTISIRPWYPVYLPVVLRNKLQP